MNIITYIWEEALILIPVLIIIGMIIKNIDMVPDKFIPLILLIFGIGLSPIFTGFTGHAVVQGVLVTGAAVYGNQIWKQFKNK